MALASYYNCRDLKLTNYAILIKKPSQPKKKKINDKRKITDWHNTH